MKKEFALTAALIMGLGLSGCGGSTPTVTPASEAPAADAVATEAPAADAVATEAPAAAATTEAQENRSAAFSDTVTFEGGVEVTVESLGFVPAGEFAYGAVEDQIAVFQITVVNNSAEEVEGGIMGYPTVRYGASGTQAENANNETVGMESLSTILPGGTQTAKVGYGIPAAEAGQVQLEIMDPTFAGKDAIFQGAIG